eukprot:SAG31_NODE_13481_length_866_cov_0.997392_1_plen_41_part_00
MEIEPDHNAKAIASKAVLERMRGTAQPELEAAAHTVCLEQ